MSSNSIIVIGASFTGATLVDNLIRLIDTTVFTRSEIIGDHTPFKQCLTNTRIGAQLVSLNVSDHSVQSSRFVLQIKQQKDDSQITKILDDDLVSTTRERPFGWNRSTGQWEHYMLMCPISELFNDFWKRIVDSNQIIQFLKGTSVHRIAIDSETNRWMIETGNGLVIYSEILVMAIPANVISPLLRPIQGLSEEKEVIERIAQSYLDVFCCLVKVTTSIPLSTRFNGKRELDVSVEGTSGVYLLWLLEDGQLVVHASDEISLRRDALLTWFCAWTRDSEVYVEVLNQEYFRQAPRNITSPLRPLRERSFIASSSNTTPLLLMCGDWATGTVSGTVSGSIVSGERAASFLVNLYR